MSSPLGRKLASAPSLHHATNGAGNGNTNGTGYATPTGSSVKAVSSISRARTSKSPRRDSKKNNCIGSITGSNKRLADNNNNHAKEQTKGNSKANAKAKANKQKSNLKSKSKQNQKPKPKLGKKLSAIFNFRKKKGTPKKDKSKRRKSGAKGGSPDEHSNYRSVAVITPQTHTSESNHFSSPTDGFEIIIEDGMNGNNAPYSPPACAADAVNDCSDGMMMMNPDTNLLPSCAPLDDWGNFVSLLTSTNLDDIMSMMFGDSNTSACNALTEGDDKNQQRGLNTDPNTHHGRMDSGYTNRRQQYPPLKGILHNKENNPPINQVVLPVPESSQSNSRLISQSQSPFDDSDHPQHHHHHQFSPSSSQDDQGDTSSYSKDTQDQSSLSDYTSIASLQPIARRRQKVATAVGAPSPVTTTDDSSLESSVRQQQQRLAGLRGVGGGRPGPRVISEDETEDDDDDSDDDDDDIVQPNIPDEEAYDTTFTLKFLREVAQTGVMLTYFKVPGDESDEIAASLVILTIKPGLARGSRLLEPKLCWTNLDEPATYNGREEETSVSLIGIHSIHNSLSSNAEQTSIFTITTEDGDVHAFEAPTLKEQMHVVNGIRNVVAWLSYHLVMGNMASGTELVSDLDEQQGDSSGELPSLKTPVQAMNELSHDFLD